MSESGFEKWMEEVPEAEHIGKVAVFYIPSKKLTTQISPRIHDFFVSKDTGTTGKT